MAVAPAERALLLLIRARDHGELTLVFRGGLPTYAKQIEQCIHLGRWQGTDNNPARRPLMTRREIVTELTEILRDLAHEGIDMVEQVEAAVARIQALKDQIEAEGDVAAPVE